MLAEPLPDAEQPLIQGIFLDAVRLGQLSWGIAMPVTAYEELAIQLIQPRHEAVEDIAKDTLPAMEECGVPYYYEPDRFKAIKWALEHCEKGDVLLLAGKGHEDYQEIKGVKYDMDERVLIAEVVKESKRENLICTQK